MAGIFKQRIESSDIHRIFCRFKKVVLLPFKL